MASWARHLRKVEVSFCPFTTTPTTGAFLAQIATKKVREASPQLKFSRNVLPRQLEGGDTPAQTAVLTYVDGTEQTIDMAPVQIRDVLEEIDLVNGRLESEASARGRPWS